MNCISCKVEGNSFAFFCDFLSAILCNLVLFSKFCHLVLMYFLSIVEFNIYAIEFCHFLWETRKVHFLKLSIRFIIDIWILSLEESTIFFDEPTWPKDLILLLFPLQLVCWPQIKLLRYTNWIFLLGMKGNHIGNTNPKQM